MKRARSNRLESHFIKFNQFNSANGLVFQKRNLFKLIKKRLAFAIENELVDVVQEIVCNNKFSTNIKKNIRSKTRLINKPNPNKETVLGDLSNSLDQPMEVVANSSRENLNQIDNTKSTISLDSFTSVSSPEDDGLNKTTPKRKLNSLKKINWRLFYIDSENKDNPLHYACRLGKTCLIDLLLDSGYFSIDDVNNSFETDTPLTIACDLGWIDTAKILIARGANVNYENRKSKTPLILASELVYSYDTEMCKILISNGALVNKVTSNGNTVLLSASKFGNMELISLLLHANANINRQYNDGASPLMRACYYNYPNLVNYLLEHRANIECKNVRNETPLYIASFRGFIEIARILVDKFNANVNCEDIDGDTPLSVACYEERTHIISYLLRKGAIVNKHGIRGDTPLHIAVSNCSNESVMELIKYGANVDALNGDKETPLHIVTRQNRIEILNTLLLHAKQLDICSSLTKRTPFKNLMDNIQIDKLEMAICLIKAGCNVNLSYNQFSFTCTNVYQQTNTSIVIRNQTEYSQTFSLINSKESPFKWLFKINKNKFKFYEKLSQTANTANSIEGVFDYNLSNNSAFRAMLMLVDLIFKAGYRINQNDMLIYKESWVYGYLSTHDLKTKALFDYYFVENLNKPSLLVNLCRARIRSCLVKPIFNSISLLHIPIELKSFLNLEF